MPMPPFLLLALVLPLAGCLGSDTRYYSFSAIKAGEVKPVAVAADSGFWVVGPVKLYEEVDRPQLVVRRSDSQVEIRERDLWAGSLEQGIARLLVDGLGYQFPGRQLVNFPWTGRGSVALRISPEIRQLSATPGQEMVLTLVWTLYDPRTDRLRKLEAMSFRRPAPGDISSDQLVLGYRSLFVQAVRALAPHLASYR